MKEHVKDKMKNMYEMLADVCARNRDKVFFVRENRTYADLLHRVKLRAVLLAKRFKIKKGDVVALLCSNIPEFIESYYAILSQGARALLLDTGLAHEEHINMMTRTGAKLALADKTHMFECDVPMFDIENVDDTDEADFVAADVNHDDIAQMSFTSGSTGNPKIVGITHGNLLALCEGAEYYTHVVKPGFTFYGFLPLYHIYGIVINVVCPVTMQGKLLLQPVLKPAEFIKDWAEYKPEVIPAVPRIWEVFYKKIVDQAREKHMWLLMRMILSMQKVLRKIGLGKLVDKVTEPVHKIFGGRTRVLVSAGAPLKPTIRKFYEKLGFSVGDCFGLTETTGPALFNWAVPKIDGRGIHYAGPLVGNELKIHNPDKDGVGEIWFRGNMLMPGYIGNDEANAAAFEDGWFKTGDVGMLDSKGRLIVKGRQKQLIVLESGKKIWPEEMEDLYLQNADILAAAVFEYKINGKVVPYAVFQVKPGTKPEYIALLVKASNLKIAQYKWVKHFAITDKELPQTSAKKIKHFMVKELLDKGEYQRYDG
ncbi:MAG: acyl--CoA ligase [Alphaproteobacteria bacterium]|nr:acyl--CoA ligase [Alphaproteobacteria bacterium]